MKKLRITVDGKAFDVSVELLDQAAAGTPAPVASAPVAAAPAPVAATPAPAAAAPVAAGTGSVPSPLAGKIISLDVAIGSQVTVGQQLLTLEAMKMNTIIYSPAAGTLSAYCVAPGEAVQEGQALASIN